MVGKPTKARRCAVYTRKSTEHGLELEFNSLDAQREACEAYIKSQLHEGWQLSAKRYDDAAYSGGNMERPALQKLLKDIQDGDIDVVVVYKIDRLTRSLADFAKLVEVFDAKSVSFVAVTQQFNTTTSMGRLTLNVLLSFAQFERELASERVRDKVAASRKKGKWTGGSVPLGYEAKDKKLVVNPAEANIVRLIFTRYLVLKTFQKLIDELNSKGVVTKTRPIAGRTAGGIPFTYGPLAYLLKNRTYLGETGHDGCRFAGEHEPIIERGIFDQVQALLKANSDGRTGKRQHRGALLAGFLFDDRGNRMSPSFSTKRGIRYPFYVSSALLRGKKEKAGTIARVPAAEIEAAILIAIRTQDLEEGPGDLAPRELIERTVDRVVIDAKHVRISLKNSGNGATHASIKIPRPSARKRDRVFIDEKNVMQPERVANQALIQAVVRAHTWLNLLTSNKYDSVESLAFEIGLHPKVIRSQIRLAFLGPAATKAILNGEHGSGAAVATLNQTISTSWTKQYRHLLKK